MVPFHKFDNIAEYLDLIRNILFKTDNSIEFSNMLTSVAVKTRCHTENLPTLDRHIFKKKR